MPEHAPINEYDMALVTNCVTRYKAAGLESNYDVEDRQKGIVRIIMENPVRRDGSIVILEIHKLMRSGVIFRKTHWVVQLYSASDHIQPLRAHGCSFGNTQARAVTEAERDIQANFLSVCSFDLAARA